MRATKPRKETVVTDIWGAIEPNAVDSAQLRIRSVLLAAIQTEIHKREWRQKDVAKNLKISQPRVSDLQRGLVDRFGIDSLVGIVHQLGLEVEVHIKPIITDF
jgi:predicted XRE-type DNA-binding protein